MAGVAGDVAGPPDTVAPPREPSAEARPPPTDPAAPPVETSPLDASSPTVRTPATVEPAGVDASPPPVVAAPLDDGDALPAAADAPVTALVTLPVLGEREAGAAPAAWDGHAAHEAVSAAAVPAPPAHFDVRALTVVGPVGVPASFELTREPVPPAGGPAHFEAPAQIAGPLGVPASFEAPSVPTIRAAIPHNDASLDAAVAAARRLAAGRRQAWLVRALGLLAMLGGAGGLAGYQWHLRTLAEERAAVAAAAAAARLPPPPIYVDLARPRPLPAREASFEPLSPRPQQVVIKGSGTLPKVALTFDACSTHSFVGWDDRVMDILERYEVPATFFLGGRFVAERPETAQLLAENPLFDLQGHTYFHPHLPEVTPRKVVQELVETDWAVFSATGRRATMFRPPYGEYSVEVVKAATAAGYLPIQYDVASGDPDPSFHAGKLLESLLTQVRPGSIVVLHANGHGQHTPSALPLIIDALRERGYELTTVGDVLAEGDWEVDDGRKGPRRKKPPPPPPPSSAPEATPISAVAPVGEGP
ncbi:MAG: polysaccharide deacetylase family protein [Myxococcota bacterium]